MAAQLTIIYEKGAESGWVASVPEVPGAFSQGQTQDEARENVLDALAELMAARRALALQERRSDSVVESIPIPA
ncbi:MAG: type II toxin-antitoxin system HicB family antitoxin [Phycisphaerae bacterium]